MVMFSSWPCSKQLRAWELGPWVPEIQYRHAADEFGRIEQLHSWHRRKIAEELQRNPAEFSCFKVFHLSSPRFTPRSCVSYCKRLESDITIASPQLGHHFVLVPWISQQNMLISTGSLCVGWILVMTKLFECSELKVWAFFSFGLGTRNLGITKLSAQGCTNNTSQNGEGASLVTCYFFIT